MISWVTLCESPPNFVLPRDLIRLLYSFGAGFNMTVTGTDETGIWDLMNGMNKSVL